MLKRSYLAFIVAFLLLFVGCGSEYKEEDFQLECTVSSMEVLQGEEINVHISFKNTKKLPLTVSYSGPFLKYCFYNDKILIPEATTNERNTELISDKAKDFKIPTDSLEMGEYYFYAYVQFECKGQQFEIKTKEVKITILTK